MGGVRVAAARSAVGEYADDVVARVSASGEQAAAAICFHGNSIADRLAETSAAARSAVGEYRRRRCPHQRKWRKGRRSDPRPWRFRSLVDLPRLRRRRVAPSANTQTTSSPASAQAANRPSRRSASTATRSPIDSPRLRPRRASPSTSTRTTSSPASRERRTGR